MPLRQALFICLFNPYKGKDRVGEVLAQNVEKSGFEMAKCDKHSRKQGIVFSIRDAYLYKVKAQLDREVNRSSHGTDN